MRLLLDECVPKKLGNLLVGHEVKTVAQCGWSGLKNGQLLSAAQSAFDVFLTVDQNLHHQQNIPQFSIGVLIIRSRSNDIELLKPLVSTILKTLGDAAFRGIRIVES